MLKLKEKYYTEAIPKMKERFGYKSNLAVPVIQKVTANTGFGRLVAGKTKQEIEKACAEIINDLAMITGQKPVLTNAKNSIANFKLRKGMPVGAKVTLRGEKMYALLERLIYIVLPRTRDFSGISTDSIDKVGNLTIGIREHISFPEVSAEKASKIFGLEIVISTSAKSKEEGLELFSLLGFPLKQSLSESEPKGEA
jgi:large subunit ribosomal protein L5